MTRFILIVMVTFFFTGACTVILDDIPQEKSRSEKVFPDEVIIQTNTVTLSNSQTVITNIYTNTIIETEYITNTQYYTNLDSIFTNTVISNYFMTNTIIQTNAYYYTNTILSNVDNTISVLLTAPADNAYLADTFTVTGFTPDGNDLAGAMIYIESTNEVMVQAQYSELSSTDFSTTITVDKEGHYFLWASAWDSGNAIGRSDKIYVIADWSAPEVAISTPQGTNVSGMVTITGTAYDRVSGLLGVYLSVDGGGYQAVTGLESWSHNLNLAVGSHIISVYSRDAAGYVSLSESIIVSVE